MVNVCQIILDVNKAFNYFQDLHLIKYFVEIRSGNMLYYISLSEYMLLTIRYSHNRSNKLTCCTIFPHHEGITLLPHYRCF